MHPLRAEWELTHSEPFSGAGGQGFTANVSIWENCLPLGGGLVVSATSHSAKRWAHGPHKISICGGYPRKECGWRLSHPLAGPKGDPRESQPPAPTLTLELPSVLLLLVLSRFQDSYLERRWGDRSSRGLSGPGKTRGGHGWVPKDKGTCGDRLGQRVLLLGRNVGLAAAGPSSNLSDLQPEGGVGGALGSQRSVLDLFPGHGSHRA